MPQLKLLLNLQQMHKLMSLIFVTYFHGTTLLKCERMALDHILWLINNSNPYLARSCILHILRQDSSLHKYAKFDWCIRERSGSVVECLTGDRRAASSSVTALWSLRKTHLS